MYSRVVTMYETLCFVGGSCGYICSDGSLWVCGNNDRGQLGLGTEGEMVPTATLNDFFGRNDLVLRDIFCSNGGKYMIAVTTDNQLFGAGHGFPLGFSSDRNTFTKNRISSKTR